MKDRVVRLEPSLVSQPKGPSPQEILAEKRMKFLNAFAEVFDMNENHLQVLLDMMAKKGLI
jgi:hypothetical protein